MEQGGTLSRCNGVREAFNHISVEIYWLRINIGCPGVRSTDQSPTVLYLPAYIPSPVGVRCWTAQQAV